MTSPAKTSPAEPLTAEDLRQVLRLSIQPALRKDHRMPTLEMHLAPRTWGISEPWHDVKVPIRYRQLAVDGHKVTGTYDVVRADNGHSIGRVYKSGLDPAGWVGLIWNGAYYPVDANIMERTERHPQHNAESWARGEVVDRGARTREDAAVSILWKLGQRRAAAVEDLVEAHRATWLATREVVGVGLGLGPGG